MQFPRDVFRVPGKKKGSKGVTFDEINCADRTAYDEALKAGWSPSIADAQVAAKASGATKPKAPEPAPDAPPTRAELEQEAKDLGIEFDGRWGNKRLGEAIAAAHAAKASKPSSVDLAKPGEGV